MLFNIAVLLAFGALSTEHTTTMLRCAVCARALLCAMRIAAAIDHTPGAECAHFERTSLLCAHLLCNMDGDNIMFRWRVCATHTHIFNQFRQQGSSG